jgi:hypothetical protein
MNTFDASYFEGSISDTEAQITDPRRHVGRSDFAIEGRLPLSCKPGVRLFLQCQLVFTVAVVGYE